MIAIIDNNDEQSNNILSRVPNLINKCVVYSVIAIVGSLFFIGLGFSVGMIVGKVKSKPVEAEGNLYYKNGEGKYHKLSTEVYKLERVNEGG